ncbi:DUF411 domain-containing protein [Celeribacter indicus]|uniref:Metal-binding protein n=1 Tax=Celeribacter indicus TaxID=1208324 RepID=A0A0B5DZ89_9RHOB|nr:DUF411 domain-containing protein [Celeribacter indicus]AJE48309.1 hypothetical protein P73_3594 [Celeribacter indicus]SDW72417.1 Uncharacterized conserved protein [Celeribacter indicus]
MARFPLSRRKVIASGLALAGLWAAPGLRAEALPGLRVYKDPTCGCCGAWIEVMRDDGFPVELREVDTMALARLKAELGIPEDLASCHTAVIEGYVVEGHVPPADLRRLLAERPEALGLSVPGMPYGAPGMGPESERDAYDVLLMTPGAPATVFAHYDAAPQ